jgi:hypothetical protein
MARLIKVVLIVACACGLIGCFGPAYGPTYGYPDYGYAPYAYGWPIYARGYEPDFDEHHRWEEHHEFGHPHSFYHGPEGGHFGGHPGGHFGGHPGGFGGHGGGGHR